MPTKLNDLLKKQIPQESSWKITLLEQWPQVIGDLHAHVTLEKIEDEVLILGVPDSSWLQELYLLSPMILQRINTNLDLPRIKRLRFKQVQRKKRTRATQKTTKSITPEAAVSLTHKEQRALNDITDPALRTALKKFLIRCRRENS